MTSYTRLTIVIALVICIALPAWGQQYLLYTPEPVTAGQDSSSKDGILVQEIEIRKGDTLYDLSRKFNGRGMYFPQILLFNSIKNPDLIYAGKLLKIPVTQKGELKSVPTEMKQKGASIKYRATGVRKTAADHTKKTIHDPASLQAKASPLSVDNKSVTVNEPAADAAAGQKLFEAAVKAYRQEDCRSALTLLDRYLADNSGSPLAADANLYKAECYLKLSAQ